MKSAKDDSKLRDVALEAVDMIVDAGFTKPLSRLTIDDRDELIQVRLCLCWFVREALFASKVITLRLHIRVNRVAQSSLPHCGLDLG